MLNLYKEKLANLLFIKLYDKNIKELFHLESIDEKYIDDIYFPLLPSKFASEVVKDKEYSKISIGLFIDGMITAIASDPNFKYNEIYRSIIKINGDKYLKHIKKTIANLVKTNNYYDAFVMLKGLVEVENNIENYEKFILVGLELVNRSEEIKVEVIRIINEAIAKHNYYEGNKILSHIYYNEKEYDKALISLSEFISKGGKLNDEDEILKQNLEVNKRYEKAKELIYEEPEEALEILLPLSTEYEDNPLIKLHIGVCYRLTSNNIFAINYLEEALKLDNSIVDIFNELGLNYAIIEDFTTSVMFFEKAFIATKSVEIGTNLILSYLNSGETEKAKNTLEEVKELDNDNEDEILKDIEKLLNP